MTNYVTSAGVQQFTITIPSGSLTATATINAIGSGAFINYTGDNASATGNAAEGYAYLTLTNSTTITATRNTSTAGTIVITGTITDGDTTHLISSVQYGTISISSGSSSGTAGITGITNTNAVTHYLGYDTAATSISFSTQAAHLSLSGSTVTATTPANTSGVIVGFEVIAFQGSALNQSTQNYSATSSSNVTSFSVTGLSAVVEANAINFYGGSSIATVTTNFAEGKMYGSLASTTSVQVNVNTGVSDAKTYNGTLVEFVSGLLHSSVQRGTTTLSSAAYSSTSLSTVNQSYALLSWLGNTTTVTGSDINEAEGLGLLGYSSITIKQIVTATETSSLSYTITIGAVTSGSAVVVAVAGSFAGGNGTVSSVTDSASQTYTQVPGAQGTCNSAGGNSDMWYFQNSTSGVTSVTVNVSKSTNEYFFTIYELAGIIASGNPVDDVGVINNQPKTTTPSTASITTNFEGDIIISVISVYGGSLTSIPYPYALVSGSNNSSYNNTGTTVSNQQVSGVSSNEFYCATTVSFLANTVSNSVNVFKNSSTGNITAAWEVAEFPVYVTPQPTLTIASAGSLSFIAKATAKSIGTFTGSASLAPIGKSAAKSAITIGSAAFLSFAGKEMAKSVFTVAASSNLAPVGKSLGKSILTITASASLTSVGKSLSKSAATFNPGSSFDPMGVQAQQSVTTFNPATTLTFVGSGAGNILTIAAHATLAPVGTALKPTTASFAPATSLTFTGTSLGKSLLNIAVQSSLTPDGKSTAKTSLSIAAQATLAPVGRSLNKSAVTVAAGSAFSPLGHALFKSVATFSPFATFTPTGVETDTGQLTIATSISLEAVGASQTNSLLNVAGNTSLAGQGAAVTMAATDMSAVASYSPTGHAESEASLNIASAALFSPAGRGIRTSHSQFFSMDGL